jgi:hypothetical protein
MAKQTELQKNKRTALVVGADRLGTIPMRLAEEGVQIIHWRGRNNSFKTKAIPIDVDMVILYWDFVNHPLMQNVKKQAKARGIPLIFNHSKSYR